jgi:hypothetical protein
MNNKANSVTRALMAAIILLLLAALATAFDTSTSSYSADSFHHGTAGGVGETSTYTSRGTLTYEQGGNGDATTTSYASNSGWFGAVTETAGGNTTINSYDCSNNSATYYPCSSMLYGMNITHIRANCTILSGTITDVRFTLHNTEDNTDYISSAAYTYNNSDNYVLNASYRIQDSGDWKLTVTCSGTNGSSASSDIKYTNWTVPWGWVNASLVQPTTDMQAEINREFTFQSKLACYGGECGLASATLDPQSCTEEYICTNDTKRACINNTEGTEDCIEIPFDNCRTETTCVDTPEEPQIEFSGTEIPGLAKLNEIFEARTTIRCTSGSCGNVIASLDPTTRKPSIIKRMISYFRDMMTRASITGLAAGELVPTSYDPEKAFYTLDPNPATNDCLADMKQGDECTVSWRVNATGMPGTTADIYIIANAANGNTTKQFESPHTTLTITGRAWKIAAGTVYTAGQNITDGTKLLGKKRYSLAGFDTHFVNISRTESGLRVIFFHDNQDLLPISVEGVVQYSLDKTSSGFMEPAVLDISYEEGIIPKFWLVIGEGENKEVFEFGKLLPYIEAGDMVYSLKDRDDTKMDIRLIKGFETAEIKGIDGKKEIDANVYTANDSGMTTNIIAIRSIPMEEATITLNKRADTTVILACDDDKFDYDTGQCSGWAATGIEFLESAVDVTFTVDHFTAYAGGNISNNETGQLIIWDENDPSMPNASQYRTIGQRTLFFADYRASSNGTRITDANCTISFSDNQTGQANYNTTYLRYAYNRTFDNASSYSYTVTCYHPAYPATTATDTVPIGSAASKTGAVPTVDGAIPFYTTSSNPQGCNVHRAGTQCLNTWQVNTTGILGTAHTFFTTYNLTSNIANVAGNQTQTVQITITANDTEAPKILSTTVAPRATYTGQAVKIYSTASDNMQIASCYANVTLPDSSIIRLNSTCTNQQSFTTTQTGRHNITFFVNDTSRNSATATDSFEVFAPFTFTVTTNYSNGSVQTEMTIINPVTGDVANNNDTNGTYTTILPDTTYNLLFKAFTSKLQVLIRGVNISAENNKTFGMDRLATAISGYIATYGISNNYTFTNATLKIYYDDTNYTSETGLKLFKCDDWNFTGQNCTGSWTDITGQATQDTALHYFEVTITSFSGFSLSETAAQEQAGGGNNNIILPAACQETWNCTEWTDCHDNIRTRRCEDTNSCGTTAKRPQTQKTCYGECAPDWKCSDWTPCSTEGTTTRQCTDMNSCTLTKGRPSEEQACKYNHCSDKTQNFDEQGIDCGGSCKKCIIPKAPKTEKPAMEAPTKTEEIKKGLAIIAYFPFLLMLSLIATILYLMSMRKNKNNPKTTRKR